MILSLYYVYQFKKILSVSGINFYETGNNEIGKSQFHEERQRGNVFLCHDLIARNLIKWINPAKKCLDILTVSMVVEVKHHEIFSLGPKYATKFNILNTYSGYKIWRLDQESIIRNEV